MQFEFIEDTWESVLNETEWLLENWWFVISAKGLIYSKPTTDSLCLRDLDRFVRRIRLVCDSEFPQVVVFDLGDTEITEPEWGRIRDFLHAFAEDIGACLGLLPPDGVSASTAVVYRVLRSADGIRTERVGAPAEIAEHRGHSPAP